MIGYNTMEYFFHKRMFYLEKALSFMGIAESFAQTNAMHGFLTKDKIHMYLQTVWLQFYNFHNYPSQVMNRGPKSRAFYRIQATRKMTGGGNVIKKKIEKEHKKNLGEQLSS